jgi:hypothetical protein
MKIFKVARFVRLAIKQGTVPVLDKFLQNELLQSGEAAQNPLFAKWIFKELYGKFDRVVSENYLEQINLRFRQLVEEGVDKRQSNQRAYQELVEQIQPLNFYEEKNNLHVYIGQVYSWLNATKRDLKSEPTNWEEAKRLADTFLKQEAKKGGDVHINVEDVNHVLAITKYLSENPEIADSDLHVELISVPRGMKPEQIKAMENRCEQEGTEGKHCLYTNYWNTIKSGQAIAISIRDPKNAFIATARIDIDDLIEIKGYSNQPPPDEYKQAILKWIMNLRDLGLINKISGLADVSNMLSTQAINDILEGDNLELKLIALMTDKVPKDEVEEIYNEIKLNPFPQGIKAIITNNSTPITILEDILDTYSKDQNILSTFGQNKALPVEIGNKLLQHPNQSVRYSILSGNSADAFKDKVTEPDLVGMSANEGSNFNGGFLSFALSHPNTPIESINSILSNSQVPVAVSSSALVNKNLSDDIKKRIFSSFSDEEIEPWVLRTDIDAAKFLSTEQAMKLTKSNYNRLRQRLAHNSNIPEVLTELAKDKYPNIRTAVADNDNTPPETLMELAKDNDYNVREGVGRNDNTPPETLMELAKDNAENVRKIVGRNDNTPPETLMELAKDNDYNVREAVAKNYNAPPEILIELAKDNDDDVREAVAKNYNSPPETLMELVNYIVPVGDRMYGRNEDVRIEVAKHKNTPPEALIELVKDESDFVYREVAKHKNTPPETLIELSNFSEPRVRAHVAQNINTPTETLMELTKDNDDDVRNTAKNTLKKAYKITRMFKAARFLTKTLLLRTG